MNYPIIKGMYKMTRKQHHKGYVLILSVFEGSAFWTAHPWEGSSHVTLAELENILWRQHAAQINAMRKESDENEDPQFTEMSIDDQTASKN